MSVDLLNNDIKTSNFRKIYFIYGDEGYLKKYYFDELIKALFPREEEKIDLIFQDASSLSSNEFSDILCSFPMIAKYKVLVIKDLKANDAAAEFIIKNYEELNDGIVVIIYNSTESLDERLTAVKNLKKTVSDNGLCVDVKPLDSATLRRWVTQQFRKRGKEIDYETVVYLLSQTSNEMYFLFNEIEKLASYCEKSITKKEIDLITSKTPEAKTYELTDAIFDKNAEKAFEVVKTLLDIRTNEIMIMGSVFTAFCSVYKVKMLAAEGLTTGEIAAATGLKEFVVMRNIEKARRIKPGVLEKLLRFFSEIDVAAKSTFADNEALLYELISETMAVL